MHKVLITGGSGFIGTHLVDFLLQKNFDVLNIDIQPPIDSMHLNRWSKISILDFHELDKKIKEFNPSYIVHLAAVTTQNADSLLEFQVNILGTENIIRAANGLISLKKFIFTSSQYAITPGNDHSLNDEDIPYGLYGESKLIGEKLTKNLLSTGSWVIIRPTAIWGPWHAILSQGLWKQLAQRNYIHPRSDSAIKGYGFVKNSAWQIERIMSAPTDLTESNTYYIGDGNLNQKDWVNQFSVSLTGKSIRLVPKTIIQILSEVGEFLSFFGIEFPIFRSRFKNLITSNPVPLEPTIGIFGCPPFTLAEGVEETVNWFQGHIK